MLSNFVSRFSSQSPSRSRSSSISTASSTCTSSQASNGSGISSNIRSKSSSSKAGVTSINNSSNSKIKKKDIKKNKLVVKINEQKLLTNNSVAEQNLYPNISSYLASKVQFFESINKPFDMLNLNENKQSSEEINTTAQSLYHNNNNLQANSKMFFVSKPLKESEILAEEKLMIEQKHQSTARFCDEPEYRMNNPKRGYAVIINNKIFDSKLDMGKRDGTDRDAACLESCLTKLGFEIKIFHNLTAVLMRDIMHRYSKMDHSNSDCFMCVIMSHGDNGIIYGTDQEIELEQLIHPFKFNRSLLGKPKIFFIQACRGTNLMEGIDSNPFEVQYVSKLPLEADFLISYSTVAGYFSWRNSQNGSWFIQSLCQVLNENGKKAEIIQLLTAVNRKVAYYFESNTNDASMHGKKQIPCIVSMLTKELYFRPKS